MTPATPDDPRTEAPPAAPAEAGPAARATKASTGAKATKSAKTTKSAKAATSTKATNRTKPATAAKGAKAATTTDRGPAPVAEVAATPEPEAATELADALATGGLPGPTSPEALAAWLVGRRWYAGADPSAAEPLQVTLATVALPVDPPLATGLVDTHRDDRYQLLVPLSADADRPDVGDDPGAAGVLARWIAGGGTSADGPSGRVVGHWLDGTAPLGDGAARPLGGEQSNTSVIIGGTHVLKLFRRLQPGPHPEIEVGRHLAHTADAGTAAPVARLAGWYEHEADGETTALGVVQELVPGALDAWGLVLSGLAGDPGGLLARLRRLGTAVAELHGALAVPAHDAAGAAADAPEAFGAVPLVPDRLRGVVDGIGA
ncbi:MAG TPA: hypothetical protein VHK88_17685, partial [Aquihabitans sp.]|nr:hypothetical protein [Aquihabitans sp.]